jgi:hypothetical protein
MAWVIRLPHKQKEVLRTRGQRNVTQSKQVLPVIYGEMAEQ